MWRYKLSCYEQMYSIQLIDLNFVSQHQPADMCQIGGIWYKLVMDWSVKKERRISGLPSRKIDKIVLIAIFKFANVKLSHFKGAMGVVEGWTSKFEHMLSDSILIYKIRLPHSPPPVMSLLRNENGAYM